jgi:hypothetical protein
VLIDRLDVVAHDEPSAWPFSVPAVRDVAEHGLKLTSNLVVLIGANGSGKSTLLEAIAEAYGIDVRGGHGARRYGSYLDKGPLRSALRLSRTAAGRRFTGPGLYCWTRPKALCRSSPPSPFSISFRTWSSERTPRLITPTRRGSPALPPRQCSPAPGLGAGPCWRPSQLACESSTRNSRWKPWQGYRGFIVDS